MDKLFQMFINTVHRVRAAGLPLLKECSTVLYTWDVAAPRARHARSDAPPPANQRARQGANPALLTDLYELRMMESYRVAGMAADAVFDLHVRTLGPRRNYLLACGLEDALGFLETVTFDGEALDYLATLGFSGPFLEYLRHFRFTGDVYAILEGTPVFPFEPIIEVVAPLPEAQLVETFLINQVGVQTLLASKAARVVAAAAGRPVVDFGFRRMHGLDAGVKGARAFYVAGLSATSNVAAGELYGIPVAGTMAHSYVQAFDQEYEAFRSFAALNPTGTLLLDTYDTLTGAGLVVRLAGELGSEFRIGAVRLDSGDLVDLSRRVRQVLDDAGLGGVRVFASGGLDEDRIATLVASKAPIDAFGIGTDLGVSRDAPALDMVYKLVAYDGRDRLKLSPDKRVLPGRKQVYRLERDGVAVADDIARSLESRPGRALMRQVMKDGRRLPAPHQTLADARALAKRETAVLPPRVRGLQPAMPEYPAHPTPELERHYEELAARKRAIP